MTLVFVYLLTYLLNAARVLEKIASPPCAVWHRLPVKDDVQVQVNVPFWCDTQVPLFRHGWEAHGWNVTAWLHWGPVQPGLHTHVYVVPVAYEQYEYAHHHHHHHHQSDLIIDMIQLSPIVPQPAFCFCLL